MRLVFHRAIIGLVVLAAFAHHAAAQDYPTHSVTIAQKLEQRFGKSFVIENSGI
jgi:hypothetical protein